MKEDSMFCTDKSITVMKVSLLSMDEMNYDELFRGFDDLHVVTYSIGLKQVENVMKYFKKGEIIIGSPSQIRQGTAELFAEQEYSLASVCSNPYLQMRMKAGELDFYVSNGRTHEKLYLLHANDGRSRIIAGSANFSVTGWSGNQGEIYFCFDNDEALYQKLYKSFERLRDDSSSRISKKAVPIDEKGTNVEDLPIFKKVVETGAAIVVAPIALTSLAASRLIKKHAEEQTESETTMKGSTSDDLFASGDDADADGGDKEMNSDMSPDEAEELEEEVKYSYAISRGTKEWAERMNKIRLKEGSDGLIHLRPDHIVKMKAYMKEAYKVKQEKLRDFPELYVDYENKMVSFDGKLLDLSPAQEDVKRDIQCLYKYIDGADSFTGNTDELKDVYWKVLLYMFLSPFMARFRLEYSPFVPANSVGKYFPMFLMIRGPKNGGKSSLIRTGQYLIFGKKLKNGNNKEISPASMYAFEASVKGCPILFDDVTNNRLKYLNDIVKADDILINEHNIHHGTILFTTNQGENIDPAISKRMVVFTIKNQVTENESVKRDSLLNVLQHQMGTAFYRAFLSNMLNVVDDFSALVQAAVKPSKEWFPDVFALGYEVFVQTIKESGMAVHSSLHPFTWDDFLGEYTKAEEALRFLENFFRVSPQCFSVDQKNDILNVDFTPILSRFNPKMVQKLQNELPVDMKRASVGNTIVLRYSKAKEYTGLDFVEHKSLPHRLLSIFNRS